MFSYDPETRYSWINPTSLEPERQFELVGILLGLALYNGVILGINFAPLVYKKLVDEEVGLDNVKVAFLSLGKGLEMLLEWADGDVEDVFMRSFDIEYEVWGKVKTYPLVNGGSDIPVTNENRKEYVDKHYVHESVKWPFSAFKRGFQRVCGGPALKMCRAEELEMLICGTNELDFKELELAQNTTTDMTKPSSDQVTKPPFIVSLLIDTHKKQNH
ncbi:UNVERIFIED_CONTAM: putative E3 ubiquitin-protein ligase HTD2 [Siphonaria sp. JEL0065]|nr:putative E3 ubiquitin-protein ligase HTD2 [Siphonaria sp. JEL0065]